MPGIALAPALAHGGGTMGKTATDMDRARRPGPRSGVRSIRQEAQVASSRREIVDALRDLLRSRRFDDLSVEDILAVSGVSRATFYRHFKSRRDVVVSMYEVTMERAIPHFQLLGSVASGSLPAIRWARHAVEFYRAEGQISVLIHGLAATDEAFHEKLRQDRQMLIRLLAADVPAFAAALGDDAPARRQRARADIFFMMVDRISAEITLFAELADMSEYEAVLAERIDAFLQGVA